jgi:hypothetical protein
MPVLWNTDGSVVEARWRQRVGCPRQPVPEENSTEGHPLPSRTAESEQEGKSVAHADLRESVFKGEVGDWLVN